MTEVLIHLLALGTAMWFGWKLRGADNDNRRLIQEAEQSPTEMR